MLMTGDLTDAASLAAAVDGVDALVVTHGSHGGRSAEAVDYGGVRTVLQALNGRRVHIALTTAIGVTRRTVTHDWKRRGERLVRASGLPYTIVRPGWFDYNDDDQHQLVLLQGDRRHAGTPADGAVSRRQLAQVPVRSIGGSSPQNRRTGGRKRSAHARFRCPVCDGEARCARVGRWDRRPAQPAARERAGIRPDGVAGHRGLTITRGRARGPGGNAASPPAS